MAMLQVAFLILGALVPIQGHNFQGFTKMPHPCCGADISAKGGEIWLIGTDSQIYRFNGANYVLVGGGCGKWIATTPDGWHWLIGCDTYAYRWNPTLTILNKWEKMPGGPGFTHISASSKDKAVASSNGGNVWLYDGQWQQIACCAKSVAIGENDEIWVIGTNSLVYQWNKVDKKYEVRPGGASNYIDVLRPGKMVLTAADRTVWLWEDGKWVNVPGMCARATIDYRGLYCVSPDNNIWWGNFADAEQSAQPATGVEPFQGFTKMPHPCCGADISAKGGEVWLVGTDSQIYRFNGANFVQVGGGCGKKIATSPDGWHWLIGCDTYAYRWNPQFTVSNKWERMPGGPGFTHISAANKNKAVACSGDGRVWLYDGQWQQIACCAKSVAIGQNDEIWIIGTDSLVYSWNSVDKKYELRSGGASNYIDVLRPAQMVLSGADLTVWLWRNGNWVNLPNAKCVRTTIDEGKLYCVSADNNIWWGNLNRPAEDPVVIKEEPVVIDQDPVVVKQEPGIVIIKEYYTISSKEYAEKFEG